MKMGKGLDWKSYEEWLRLLVVLGLEETEVTTSSQEEEEGQASLLSADQWKDLREQPEVLSEEAQVGYQGKVLPWKCGWTLEQIPQDSGHSTKPGKTFGQYFQVHSVTHGEACEG